MSELRFSYFGADLIGPLEALLVRQRLEIERLNGVIEAFPASVMEAVRRPADLLHPRVPASKDETDARAAMSARDLALLGQREAQLWLHECYRAPNRWELTMSDLALLYDSQTTVDALQVARETWRKEQRGSSFS